MNIHSQIYIKLCKLCGLLPDPDIEKCLSASTSRGELTKQIKVNNKVFKQVISLVCMFNKKGMVVKTFFVFMVLGLLL